MREAEERRTDLLFPGDSLNSAGKCSPALYPSTLSFFLLNRKQAVFYARLKSRRKLEPQILRELPDMMSASEGGRGVMEKRT